MQRATSIYRNLRGQEFFEKVYTHENSNLFAGAILRNDGQKMLEFVKPAIPNRRVQPTQKLPSRLLSQGVEGFTAAIAFKP